MFPLTLLATNKLLSLFTVDDALSRAINSNASAAGTVVAPLSTNQITASFVAQQIADLDLDLSYPRVLVYTPHVVNSQLEKFRAFSGTVAVAADIWSSASLEQQTEAALHFYLEGITGLLRANIGNWGDGFRYSGMYDVQVQTTKTGGFGFVQSAAVTFHFEVSI